MTKHVAVLIDVENTSPKDLDKVFNEASVLGKITHRRAYADFRVTKWMNYCSKYGLEQVHHFAYINKKGTSDGSLICDAMELMYETNIDIFCIVSSDSDYVKIAIKLKAKGKTVVGFGKKHSAPSWINICNQFIYTENYEQKDDAQQFEDSEKKSISKSITNLSNVYVDLKELAISTFDQIVKDDVVNLGYFNEHLTRKKPNFVAEYKTLGFKTMKLFISSMNDVFKIEYSNSDTVIVKKI